jgi:hypothetical protein
MSLVLKLRALRADDIAKFASLIFNLNLVLVEFIESRMQRIGEGLNMAIWM